MTITTPIENNPLLSINVKIWKFLSIILERNWSRCVAFIAPTFLLNAMQYVYLYQQWGDVTTFILNAFYTVSVFNALLRTCLVLKNRDKFEAVMRELITLYDEMQATEDQCARDMLAAATKVARFVTIFNLTAGVIDISIALIIPLFQNGRSHPFGVGIPGVDVTRSPMYEIIYITQLPSPFTLNCMYMPYVNLFVAFTMFGKAALKALRNNLQKLCDNAQEQSEEERYERLRANIIFYERIARFIKHFNDLVTYIVLIEFLLYGCVICSLLFCIIITNTTTEKFTIVMYICTMMYVLFTYYWLAHGILEMSLLVSDAAYEMQWYNCSQRFKRTLLIFIARTQNPLQIRVGQMHAMTMEVFQSLVNTSYTYFTLLHNIYNK